jgi:hypothetical protein
MPKKTRRARFSRTMSSSARRPIWLPNFVFRTVIILSTISRQVARRPLLSLGSIARRNKGASVGSVVNALRHVETIILNDDHRTGLPCVIFAARNRPDLTAFHLVPQPEIASMKSWSSLACALLATLRDCRCASFTKAGARISGTQIWIGRRPCWRSRLRCALTLSREVRVRAPTATSLPGSYM